jgi:hypothetical protein
VLAHGFAAVEQIPQLGALVLGVPLRELVAVGEEALFGACLFFVAPRAADGAVEFQFLDGVHKRHRLQGVAAGVDAFFLATRPWSIESCTERTISRASICSIHSSR